MPPLAMTGMLKDCFIFLIISQLAGPVCYFLCSLVRPCTTNKAAPHSSIILANFKVSSSLGRHLILQVTGTFKFYANVVTKDRINSVFSNKNEPYLPFFAIPCGHPKFISTASQ